MSTQKIEFYSDKLNARIPYAFGNELEWLREHAKYFNNAVMIGAGPGVMAVALMEGNPNLDLLVIDIDTCQYVKAHLEDAGFDAVKFVVMDSVEYGRDYQGRPLDFLIVDGDHSYAGVYNDILAWYYNIKSGGMIFFHDVININEDKDNGVASAISAAVAAGYRLQYVPPAPGISEVYEKK